MPRRNLRLASSARLAKLGLLYRDMTPSARHQLRDAAALLARGQLPPRVWVWMPELPDSHDHSDSSE